MQSMESGVSNFKVDPVFNRKQVKLLKKCVGIGLVGIKHDTRQEILSFLNLGNVFSE